MGSAAAATAKPSPGPPPGFPALALGLPPIGLRDRAEACFANKILTGNVADVTAADSCKTTVCSRQGEELGSAGGDEQDVTVAASGEGNRTAPDADVATADINQNGKRIVQTFTASSWSQTEDEPRADGGSRAVKKMKQILIISGNDVRVEFPYMATACTGDMEYDDMLRWLRRFHPVVLRQKNKAKGEVNTGDSGGPPCTPAPPQTCVADHDVLFSAAAGNNDTCDDVSGSGAGVKRRPPSGKISVGATAVPVKDAVPPLWRPGLIRGPATWSCQFVEAKTFGLTVDLTRENGGGGSSGSSGHGDDRVEFFGKMVPEICCSVSGISVFTATYAAAAAVSSGERDVGGACGRLRASDGRAGIVHPLPAVSPCYVASGAEATAYWRDRHRPAASATQETRNREAQKKVVSRSHTGVAVSASATAEERSVLQKHHHRHRSRQLSSTTKPSQLPSEERLQGIRFLDDLCTLPTMEGISTATTGNVESKARAMAAAGDLKTRHDRDLQPSKTSVGAEGLRGGARGGSHRVMALVREMRGADGRVSGRSSVAAMMERTRHCAESRRR